MKSPLPIIKVFVVLAIVAIVGAAVGVGVADAACKICDFSPAHCDDATGSGYQNCSAAGSSCANWEPLCTGGGGGVCKTCPEHQNGYWW